MVTSKEWVPEPQRSYSKVHPKTIVFPKRGAAIATNKKRIMTRPALLDPNLMGVASDEQMALTSYLFQWFSAFDLLDITSGTTVPQLNKGDLMPLAVPLPPIDLQTAFEKKRRDILSIQSPADHRHTTGRGHLRRPARTNLRWLVNCPKKGRRAQ